MKKKIYTICFSALIMAAVGCKKDPPKSTPSPPPVIENNLVATVEDDAGVQSTFTAVNFDQATYSMDTLTLNVFNAIGDEIFMKVANVNSEKSYDLGNNNEGYFIYASDPAKKYTTLMSGGLGAVIVTEINSTDKYIDGSFNYQGFHMPSMRLAEVYAGTFRLKY